jgi:TatD DNase family protein
MTLTDTHIHLYADEFESDRHQLIEAARKAGVGRFYLPNIDSHSIPSLYHVCDQYPDICFPMMGLHPCSVNDRYRNEWHFIEKEFSKRKFFAVGETGLDFYHDTTYRQEQEKVFILHLHVAHELNLPVVIHSRNSLDRIIEIIRQHPQLNIRGIFHCFSGNAQQAQQITAMGMYLGIGGIITFKNSSLDRVLADIPLDYLVLETDAPYLAPAPYRGKRNQPDYLPLIAEKLALLKNTTAEEVAGMTTRNALDIFGNGT